MPGVLQRPPPFRFRRTRKRSAVQFQTRKSYAAISGTATAGITEVDVVAGGKTIIITLTGDTWQASGAPFDGQRSAILQGLDSAQSEGGGWNAQVRDLEVAGAVVRTSDTVVTITLSASAAYDITATETITVTVPSAAVTLSATEIVGAPTFTVSATISYIQTTAMMMAGVGH